MKQLYPSAIEISGQYEMLSGRSYSEYTITLPDKKRQTVVPLLHSHCPHCGLPYETGKKEGVDNG